MTRIPELWWSPSTGLFLRRPGEHNPTRVLTEAEFQAHERGTWDRLPEDAVQLDRDRGTDYIRVGELISTWGYEDTYRLRQGSHRSMYLEPVDTGQPHVVALARDGWTIRHPLPCRPNLFACPFNRATVTSAQHRLGRFECTLDEKGNLVIGKEVS